MSAISAEILKLRRSWSTWILVGILVGAQLLLAYLLVYLIAQIPPPPGEPDFAPAMLEPMRTEGVVTYVVGLLGILGGPIALILGAMHSAREYGWRTMPVLLTLGPPRTAIVAAKAVALAGAVLLMVALTLAAGFLGALLVGALRGVIGSFPSIGEIGAGLAVGCLVVGAWAAFGFALGFLLRSTALAIGIGLVYALVAETVIGVLAVISAPFEAISRALIGVNSSALTASFGDGQSQDPFAVTIEPAAAAAVLAAYLIGSLIVATLVFTRRDVA